MFDLIFLFLLFFIPALLLHFETSFSLRFVLEDSVFFSRNSLSCNKAAVFGVRAGASVRGAELTRRRPPSCSHADQLLGERGSRQRWEVRRGLAGEPEAVAVAEIRHGLLPLPAGREHDRLHLQPQQDPREEHGEHVLQLRPLHPPLPHAPPQLCGW